MKKIMMISVLMGVTGLKAIQRTVLCEEMTATGCYYCPGAAMGLHDLKANHGDSVVIIAYHVWSSDPFYTSEAYQRRNYYSYEGVPEVYFDGVDSVLGGIHDQSMYSYYKPKFDQRKTVDQPIRFICSGEYDPLTRQGTLNVTIENLGTTDLTGYLRIAMVIEDTPYVWQNQTNLEWVMRDMLPDDQGTQYTIPVEDSITHIQNFTVLEADDEHKVAFVVFFQDDVAKEVIGARPEFELDSLVWVNIKEENTSDRIPRVRTFVKNGYVRFIFNNLENVNLRIFDILGRKIFSRKIAQKEIDIELGSGVYFYRAGDTKGKIVVIKTD